MIFLLLFLIALDGHSAAQSSLDELVESDSADLRSDHMIKKTADDSSASDDKLKQKNRRLQQARELQRQAQLEWYMNLEDKEDKKAQAIQEEWKIYEELRKNSENLKQPCQMSCKMNLKKALFEYMATGSEQEKMLYETAKWVLSLPNSSDYESKVTRGVKRLMLPLHKLYCVRDGEDISTYWGDCFAFTNSGFEMAKARHPESFFVYRILIHELEDIALVPYEVWEKIQHTCDEIKAFKNSCTKDVQEMQVLLQISAMLPYVLKGRHARHWEVYLQSLQKGFQKLCWIQDMNVEAERLISYNEEMREIGRKEGLFHGNIRTKNGCDIHRKRYFAGVLFNQNSVIAHILRIKRDLAI